MSVDECWIVSFNFLTNKYIFLLYSILNFLFSLKVLKKNGFQTSGNTVDGSSLLNIGSSFYSNPSYTVSSKGVTKLDQFSSLPRNDMLDLIKLINGYGEKGNSMLGETWSERLSKTLFEYKTALQIDDAIKSGVFNMDGYKASEDVERQLKSAAQYMKSRELRKVDREVYFVTQGKYDMHGSLSTLADQFKEANTALTNFVEELKRQGTWEDTVILMGSDFGRSVAPNSNGGSDHGKCDILPINSSKYLLVVDSMYSECHQKHGEVTILC